MNHLSRSRVPSSFAVEARSALFSSFGLSMISSPTCILSGTPVVPLRRSALSKNRLILFVFLASSMVLVYLLIRFLLCVSALACSFFLMALSVLSVCFCHLFHERVSSLVGASCSFTLSVLCLDRIVEMVHLISLRALR